MILLFFIISWIISHLGANPVNGGRPPSDKRVIIIIAVRSGEMFQVWLSEEVVVLLYIMNIENMEVVRKV